MDESKLELESMDIAEEKRRELLRLFPEAATEGGKIDFDQLKRALGETVDAGRERYGMNWPGKADCFRLIQSPSTATLLPVREESVRFDETENMIIEGDNLEVLKLLQKGYQGKVKMIYIDPPYNTGNDFIYPDDFTDNLKNYLQYTGQVDAEGKKFSNNTETDGRFHSNWLNMMYPRLYLARNLLKNDGFIFVSIDDTELDNLRLLLDSVFGEQNFGATFVVKSNPRGSQSTSSAAILHEYVVCYGRDLGATEGLNIPLTNKMLRDYQFAEGMLQYRLLGLRLRGGAWRREQRPKLFYPLYINELTGSVSLESDSTHIHQVLPIKPTTHEEGTWRWSRKKVRLQVTDLIAKKITRNGQVCWDIFQKDFLTADADSAAKQTKVKTIWDEKAFNYQNATTALKELFGSNEVFNFSKPISLQSRMLDMVTRPDHDDIVMDFFAGSGSTAEALLRSQSVVDFRQFILIQLPEPTGRADYTSIVEITKERVRRVILRKDQEVASTPPSHVEGIIRKEGFRVFKLAPSNFKVWEAHTDEGIEGVQRQMELAVNHILPDRTAEDLFFEILMKSEYPLTAKVERFDAAGVAAYSVVDDELIICVERAVTEEAVDAIVQRKPSKVIFLDEAFSGNDQLKANAKMNFETAGVQRFETV